MTDVDEVPTHLCASRRVVQPGYMDGLCCYFRTIFFDDLQFDTAPDHKNTSWNTIIFRTPQREYAVDDVIVYELSIDDISDTRTWTVSLAEELENSHSVE